MGLERVYNSDYILQWLTFLNLIFLILPPCVQHLATRVASFDNQNTHFVQEALFPLNAGDVNRAKRFCISHNGA